MVTVVRRRHGVGRREEMIYKQQSTGRVCLDEAEPQRFDLVLDSLRVGQCNLALRVPVHREAPVSRGTVRKLLDGKTRAHLCAIFSTTAGSNT